MGFEWEGQKYYFKQLPFGVAPACWAFTKLQRELMGYFRRSVGTRCTSYVDDSLFGVQGLMPARAQRARVVHVVEKDCGLVVSHPKSAPEPAQVKPYLGAIIDTDKGVMLVPVEKQAHVLKLISHILQTRRPTVRAVESLVGHLLSLRFSFGKLSLAMTRSLSRWAVDRLPKGSGRDSHHSMTAKNAADALYELQFWQGAFEHWQGSQPIWRSSFVHTIMHTDAAGAAQFTFGGWGAWTEYNGDILIAKGRWEFPTKPISPTWLELEAIKRGLEAFGGQGQLDEQRVLLRSDNEAAKFIVNNGGSMVKDCNNVALSILWFCIEHKIDITVEWIPREENQLADALSIRTSLLSLKTFSPAIIN